MALTSPGTTLSQWSGNYGRSVGTGQRGLGARLPENPSVAMARARGSRSTTASGSPVPTKRYLGEGPENVSDVEGLFDETGLPTRLPRNAREAMLFQLQASRSARQQQARQNAAALSTLRYGIGMTQYQSPYGLGALMSPLLSQMSSQQANVQYAPSDFSYFIRPDAYGQNEVGGGNVRNASAVARSPIFGGARRVPSSIGMGFQPEQPMPQQAAATQVPSFGFGGFGQPQLAPIDAAPEQPELAMQEQYPMPNYSEMADLGGVWI